MKFWKVYFWFMVVMYSFYLLVAVSELTLWKGVDMVVNTVTLVALFGLSYGKKGKKIINKRFWQASFVICLSFEMAGGFKYIISKGHNHSLFWYLMVGLIYTGFFSYAFKRNSLWENQSIQDNKQ